MPNVFILHLRLLNLKRNCLGEQFSHKDKYWATALKKKEDKAGMKGRGRQTGSGKNSSPRCVL